MTTELVKKLHRRQKLCIPFQSMSFLYPESSAEEWMLQDNIINVIHTRNTQLIMTCSSNFYRWIASHFFHGKLFISRGTGRLWKYIKISININTISIKLIEYIMHMRHHSPLFSAFILMGNINYKGNPIWRCYPFFNWNQEK